MTTTIHGGDVPAMLDTARAIAAGAERLLVARDRVTLLLCHTLAWNGPDATAARLAWEEEHSLTLGRVARALVEAGLALVQHAEDQERASGSGPAGAGPAAGSAGAPPSSGPAEELRTLRDLAMQLPDAATIGRMRDAFGDDLFRGAANDLRHVSAAMARVEDGMSTFERVGTSGLGVVGAGLDAAGLAASIRDGDAHGIVDGVTSLGLAGAGAAGAGWAGPAGVAWGVGTFAGTEAYEGMQGSRFGDVFTDMTDHAFEENGIAGVAQVPGLLLFAGYETLKESLGDD